MPRLYEYSQGTLTDVSDTDEGWSQMSPIKNTCVSGAAGLIGSMEEYEKLAHMLLQKGTLDGIQILKSETVEMMAGKGISHKSEMIPGVYWGLEWRLWINHKQYIFQGAEVVLDGAVPLEPIFLWIRLMIWRWYLELIVQILAEPPRWFRLL